MWQGNNSIILGDCLDIMPAIPDKSVDMILCDLPYGTTACAWDTVIPFVPLWAQYERIIKDSGAIVLTASQPFTSALVMSNIVLYKYNWVWAKENTTGFVNANLKPLKKHEDICVFSKGATANGSERNMTYNPQGLVGHNKQNRRGKRGEAAGERPKQKDSYIQQFSNYPHTLLRVGHDKDKIHPTQKPVALFEYLIRTYTNPGELVLDNCIGSGTTAIAALNTGRDYIGIELDAGYHAIATKRVQEHAIQQSLFDYGGDA